MGNGDLLQVENLVVDYLLDAGPLRAVDGVSFGIAPGEVFGMVGESGSGKSTLAQSLPRLLLPPAVIAGGRVLLNGRDLLSLSDRALRAVRGREISLVPQSGMNALNPLTTIGQQIGDAIQVHEPMSGKTARGRAVDLVEQLGLPRAAAGSYAHELSGGMRQRAVIALALAVRPALLIMDEPTAALDVIRQREILAHILALQAKLAFSVLFISHDLALTLALCNRVGVLHRGRLVETASARELRDNPRHPYTRELMAAFLSRTGSGPAPEKASASLPLLSVRGLSKTFVSGWGRGTRRVRAVDDVSFDVSAGEAVALVGESGSGKSTIVRMVARLVRPSGGEIRWKDRNVLLEEPGRASLGYRSGVQMIFQDPFAALNPARRVDYHLERPLRLHARLRDRRELVKRIHLLLENAGLTPPQEIARKYPHQLSGGQRQRVIIARALAVEPALMLADEPASMLDASIRADVVAALRRLKTERRLACIYVTHDLVGARGLAERILVLLAGRIVESGPTAAVLDAPAHPYTALLLAARPDPAQPGGFDRWERAPSATPETPNPTGCAFLARCPRAVEQCGSEAPVLREIAPGRFVRCVRPLTGSQEGS